MSGCPADMSGIHEYDSEGRCINCEHTGRTVAVVTVSRILDEDGGMRDDVATDDGQGGEIDLPTAVGMLAVAQHTLLCDGAF